MLKGRRRLIYKKCESKLHNIKYIILACVFLHIFCIFMNDPFKSRWRLEIEEIEILNYEKQGKKERNGKNASCKISKQICNWLWENN